MSLIAQLSLFNKEAVLHLNFTTLVQMGSGRAAKTIL